jgi:hypothetical protein
MGGLFSKRRRRLREGFGGQGSEVGGRRAEGGKRMVRSASWRARLYSALRR